MCSGHLCFVFVLATCILYLHFFNVLCIFVFCATEMFSMLPCSSHLLGPLVCWRYALPLPILPLHTFASGLPVLNTLCRIFAFCSFCIFVFCRAALCLHGHNFARGVPVHTLWSNLPSHCLAIDWLCIAKFQNRHNLIHILRLPDSLHCQEKRACAGHCTI